MRRSYEIVPRELLGTSPLTFEVVLSMGMALECGLSSHEANSQMMQAKAGFMLVREGLVLCGKRHAAKTCQPTRGGVKMGKTLWESPFPLE